MTLRAVSLRSLKSNKSEVARSNLTTPSDDGRQLDFSEFINQSCKRFECPVSVAVEKEVQRDLFLKSGKQKPESRFRRKSIIQQLVDMDSSDDTAKAEKAEQPLGDHTLVMTILYDSYNRLTEIRILNYHYKPVPRVLMQSIALIVPYYRQLSKFTIKRCRIDMYTIYELSKILPLCNITDVCLDQSPLREGNYDILLCDTSCIRNLSLARCNINDVICERIAARLYYLEPAETTMVALNLSSNRITDVGARHLGAALRSNRHLRYLNIADNQIGDSGAFSILEVLTEFILTPDEILEKRRRYTEYLTKKHALYYRCLGELCSRSDDNGLKKAKKPTASKGRPSMKRERVPEKMTDEGMRQKAEMMVSQLLGSFQGPFGPGMTRVIDKTTYCLGNLVLCYLNLAYNNLSFVTIQKLEATVLHQQDLKSAQYCGLMNVILDGNYVPDDCTELNSINRVLLRHIICFGGRPMFDRMVNKRKSTVAIPIDRRRLFSESE